jgi:alkaline phosphatase
LPNGPAGSGGLTPMVGRGKGQLPVHRWMTEDHANRPVPLFAKGAGSELFREFADQIDPKQGPVIDNTEIAAFIFRLLGR